MMDGIVIYVVFVTAAFGLTLWEYWKLKRKYDEEKEHSFALRLEIMEIKQKFPEVEKMYE